MPPFVPKIEKITAALKGDIGIATALQSASSQKIQASIKDSKVLAKFKSLDKPPANSGLKSLEKTTVSTMMENFKPLIEVALAMLALLGGVEVFAGKAFTGVNPYGDLSTFAGGMAAAQQALSDLREAGLAKPNATAAARPKPEIVLVGVFDENGAPVEPTNAEKLNSYYAGPWPLVRSVDDHRQSRANALKTSLAALARADRDEISQTSLDSVQDEWDFMSKEGALYQARVFYLPAPATTLPPVAVPLVAPLRGWLAPKKIKDAAGEVELDLEEDYNVEVFYSYTYKRHVVHALLKPELRPGPVNGSSGNSATRRPGTSPYFPIPLKAPILLIKLVAPIITSKLIPALTTISEIIANPATFLLPLVMMKLKEHFEWFDPSIKFLPDTDPLKQKYFSNGVFLMDGAASLTLLGATLTVGLKNAIPFSRTTPIQPGEKEQPMLKTVLGIVKMPIEILVGILKSFMDLLKKLFNPAKIVKAVADFVTFKWLIDLLSPDGILTLLGAQPGKPETIPFFKSSSLKPPAALEAAGAKATGAAGDASNAANDAAAKAAGAASSASTKAAAAASAAAAKAAEAKAKVDKLEAEAKAKAEAAAAALVANITKALLPVPKVVLGVVNMVADTMNAVVAMPLDILNVPASVRDAIPKISFA